MNENLERERERSRDRKREVNGREDGDYYNFKVNLFSCFVSLFFFFSLLRFRQFRMNNGEVKERFRAAMRDWRIKMDDDRITVSKLPQNSNKFSLVGDRDLLLYTFVISFFSLTVYTPCVDARRIENIKYTYIHYAINNFIILFLYELRC